MTPLEFEAAVKAAHKVASPGIGDFTIRTIVRVVIQTVDKMRGEEK